VLVDVIKTKIKEALIAKDDVAKNVLRFVLGQAQNEQARVKHGMTENIPDEMLHKIIKKTIEGNLEVLQVAKDQSALIAENAILNELLPKLWTLEQIEECLQSVGDQIKEAKNDGQATGVAMKSLKAVNAPVDGKDVSTVVKRVRS
jgi:uncharacterized protein YqeY